MKNERKKTMNYFYNVSTKTFLPVVCDVCPTWVAVILVLFAVALFLFFVYQFFEEEISNFFWKLK